MDFETLKKFGKDWKELWEYNAGKLLFIVFVLGSIFSSLYLWNLAELEEKFEEKENNLEFLYSERNSNLESSYDERDKNRNQELSLLKTEKDKAVMESIRCNTDSDYINFNISNSNIQNGNQVVYNGTCIDKEYTISRLVKRLKEKDEVINDSITEINYLNSNITILSNNIEDLESKIPEVEMGFIGFDIPLSEGQTYEADNGNFLLALKKTYIYTNGKHTAVISLLSKEFGVSLGQQYKFQYFGMNYTMNVKSISGGKINVKFFKNE